MLSEEPGVAWTSVWSGAEFGALNPDVCKRVVSEERTFLIQAFSRSVNQLAAELQHARRTAKALLPCTVEEICLHLHSHGAVAHTQLGFDCKPHSYVGSCHEHLTTYDSA